MHEGVRVGVTDGVGVGVLYPTGVGVDVGVGVGVVKLNLLIKASQQPPLLDW